MTAKPYTKTLQDELDWSLLNQLHGAVAQISSFCFETKKLCVTTEFVVLALVVKLTDNKLDSSVFVTGILIPVVFWFLDATGYYYQVKLRQTMELIRQRLASQDGLVAVDGARAISPTRGAAPIHRRVLRSGFNHSMWLYPIMVVAAATVWIAFSYGTVR